MNDNLKAESERLVRCWMQHESEWLRDYLVQHVEDPRINLQSILSRHFLLRGLFNERYLGLFQQEYRFSACMNWLKNLVRGEISEPREIEVVLHALSHGADNAEGLTIPRFVGHTFQSLPSQVCELWVPNYIQTFLEGTRFADGKTIFHESSIGTFQGIWKQALAPHQLEASQLAALKGLRLKVLEPACGSANDYRSLQEYGIAQFLDYTGMDLCPKNIQNAQELFPETRFEMGNVFDIAARDQAFDYCFVHDLFEHLSLEGLNRAILEICRVTRLGICAGFFNMDEIPEHMVQPVEEYHWNTLSLPVMKKLFASHGFSAQLVHVGTFLRQDIGCFETHNPNAYTFLLWRTGTPTPS